MKIIRVILILLPIFWIHCSDKPDQPKNVASIDENTQLINLKPIKEKDSLVDNIEFPQVFFEAENIDVYGFSLSDKSAQIVVRFGRDLNLISQKNIRIGQGPGELGDSTTFFFHDNQFFAMDNGLRCINIYDKDLNFINLVKVDFPFQSPIMSEDFKYFIYSRGNYARASVIDNTVCLSKYPGFDTTEIHSFPPVDGLTSKKEIILGIGAFHYFLKDHFIYLLDKDNYILTKRETNGKIAKQVKVDYTPIAVPNSMKEEWLNEHINKQLKSRFKRVLPDYVQPCAWIIPLQKGFVVVRKNGYGTSCSGLVDADYFDFDLNMLGKVKFPCFNEVFALRRHIFLNSCLFKNGSLYLLVKIEKEEGDEIKLEKWSITE